MLVAAILDNTLNLKAKITTNRDIEAYKKLMKKINDDKYPSCYYEEIENTIKENVIVALQNETNIYKINQIIPKYFAQLAVFDKKIVFDELDKIYFEFNKLKDDYLINIICLSEGKSYIITTSNKVKEDMTNLFNKKFVEDVMDLEDIWLRKEIIRRARKLIENND